MRSCTTAIHWQGIRTVWAWIAAGLLFAALLLVGDRSAPMSPYWPSELVLYGLLLVGMWANRRYDLKKMLPIPRRFAPLAYVFLVWLFGMLFEISLTVTGEGVGGLHPQTLPSFVLAQGDYIPIALISYLVIRRTQASFREVFFFAGGKSLTEGLIFSGALTSLVLSPSFWLAPLGLAYYTLAYASFIALPLLIVDEQLLWKGPVRAERHSILFFWILGFILAMGIRLFWGLIYGPWVTQLFRLPPSPLPHPAPVGRGNWRLAGFALGRRSVAFPAVQGRRGRATRGRSPDLAVKGTPGTWHDRLGSEAVFDRSHSNGATPTGRVGSGCKKPHGEHSGPAVILPRL